MVEHDPNATAIIYTRLPGHLKNQITQHCKKHNISINTFAANALKHALETQQQLPPPPPPQAPIPDPQTIVHAYLTGQTVLTPCGQRNECPGTQNEPLRVGGVSYCLECRIRVA